MTVSPLTTVIVGPGLVSFQPGCVPTASPFSQMFTSGLEVEVGADGPVLKAGAMLTVVIKTIRIANGRGLDKKRFSERRRAGFIYSFGTNCS